MRHNAVEGLVTSEACTRFLVLIPPLLAGQRLGARSFKTAYAAAFRRWVLTLLAVLALLTGLQGILMLTT